ncbi:MAG: hypothetical protein QOI70_585, partial [Microbacteriaceae bacterium]|nr:hypothetical protein [Microbacteriaceae bacterium]
MRECLREVADLLTVGRDLFGIEAEMIRVGQHLLEREPSIIDPPGSSERVDLQEGAQREGALR